jgi:outer membrane protein OmpA-like peptidoglycan-associated protein
MRKIPTRCMVLLMLGTSATALAQEEGKAVTAAKPDPSAANANKNALAVANTLDGTTGLVRVMSADSSQIGTFRLSATGTFYKGDGFLCPSCANIYGKVLDGSDSVGYSAFRLQASVTPLSFLEAFGSMRFRAVSNEYGAPRVIQTSGDTILGAKAFMPYRKGRLVTLGGGMQLSLLAKNRTIGPATANVDLMTAATMDLRELSETKSIPLRAHVNLGYRFDNTGSIADDIESNRARILGPHNRITRIERFGFGINRTDAIRFGLGAEWIFAFARPFVEWSLDISANRQGYKCRVGSTALGDSCLDRTRQFSALPSRLTLGVRGYPWFSSWADGLSLLLAADIGTGGTSTFVEETAPELPWSVTVGIGYALGAGARVEVNRVVEKKVEVSKPPPPELYVMGKVLDKSSSAPIAGVAVRLKDAGKFGVLSDEQGTFRTFALEPGKYVLYLTKDGYADGDCEATVVAASEKDLVAAPQGKRLELPTEVQCNLARLPSVANVTGVLRDADTNDFVSHATIVVVDPKGRRASLETDEYGGFRFEKVPAGAIKIQMSADGYLASGAELEVKAREDATVQLSIHKRPKRANITVTKNEVKLKRQLNFSHDSADILTDSLGILEEIAEALRTHSEILEVEIQGHTDDTGTPEHNMALSTKRANAVRDALIRVGVEPNRLTAHGYGQDKPLVPAKTAAARAKNRRVQFMIVGTPSISGKAPNQGAIPK